MSSTHCFRERSIREKRRTFSSATEACPASASSKRRSVSDVSRCEIGKAQHAQKLPLAAPKP